MPVLDFRPIFQSREVLLQGLAMTAYVSVWSLVLGFAVGLILALLRLSSATALRNAALWFIEIFRNTPFLVQLFFFYYGLPRLHIFVGAVLTGIVALSLNNGAYNAEVIRAGLEAVDKGQIEAAQALGLNRVQTYRFVVIPIALQVAFGPLSSNFINLVLTTSVLLGITVNELMNNAETIAADTFRPFEVYLTVLVLYAVLTFSLSGLLHLIDGLFVRKNLRRERTALAPSGAQAFSETKA